MSTKMVQSEVLRSIQLQLRLIERRLKKLEAVSHAQPDVQEMLLTAKNFMTEVKSQPSRRPKSTLRC